MGLGSLFGGGSSKVSEVAMPEFYTDEYFTKTQSNLYDYGSNILSGNLNDFYSSLGQSNSQEFQDMLAMVNRDTAKAVNENLVRRGISRSGVGLSSTAKAAADASTSARYSDYLQSKNEKMNLLGTGLNTLQGVGSNALQYGTSKNQFNTNITNLKMQQAAAQDAADAEENSMWSSLISSGIGAASLLLTGGTAAPLVSGSMLGSASGVTSSGMGLSSINAALSGISNYNLGGLRYYIPGSLDN